MNFYDDVLRELMFAMGAALFFGNLYALIKRKTPRPVEAEPGKDLSQAPIGRSVLYAIIGLIIMVWGIASIIAA